MKDIGERFQLDRTMRFGRLQGEAHVGTYLEAKGPTARLVVSDVLCPYCREPMKQILYNGEARRVVRIKQLKGDHADVYTQRIPSTQRLYSCKPCAQIFTLPPATETSGVERAAARG